MRRLAVHGVGFDYASALLFGPGEGGLEELLGDTFAAVEWGYVEAGDRPHGQVVNSLEDPDAIFAEAFVAVPRG